MDETQMDDRLEQLGQATLTEELLDVSTLRRRKPGMLVLGFTLLLIVVAGSLFVQPWLIDDAGQEPELRHRTTESHSDLHERALGISYSVDEPSAPSVDVRTEALMLSWESPDVRNQGFSHIDTSSVLVMHVTREEAKAFGIGRHGDGIVTTHQALVTEGKLMAYNSIQCDTSDTNALFTYTRIIQLGSSDSVKAISCDRYSLKDIAAVDAVAIDSVCVLHIKPREGYFPALACQELYDTVSEIMRITCYEERSFAYGHDVVLPKSYNLARDQKPVLVKIESDTPHGRYLVTFMPTEAVRRVIPDRFKDVYEYLYRDYRPEKPTKYRHKGTSEKPAKLTRLDGPAGQPILHADDETLRKLGILRDSAAVCHVNLGGIAVDTGLMTFQARWRKQGHQFGSATRYSCDSAVLESGRERLAMSRKQTHEIFMPVGYLDEIVPYDPFPELGTMYTTMNVLSRLDATPNTQRLARRIMMALNGIPADSLAYYYVDEDQVRIPVASLLVPLRVSSDGVRLPGRGDTLFYAIRTFLYLPTPGFVKTLPPNIQAFVRSEYSGIMAFLEQHLTDEELCAQLEQPSFVHLCQTADQPFTVESCGPIPAHEQVVVKINADQDQSVEISIRDVNGRDVHTISGERLWKGPNDIRIPISSLRLTAGVYFIFLKSNEGAATTRFLYQE
jgi:hypothetical protein